MPVRNRLAVLMAEKSIAERRRINVAIVEEEADVSHTTLNKYISQKATRFDGTIIEKLCNYFGVQVDKLIYVDPDPSLPKKDPAQAN